MKHVRRVVISGCSGGGKSSLLAELGRLGHAIVEEPGRRIVDNETDPASRRLPWNDLATFADAALALAIEDFEAVTGTGPVFFDRGVVDALVAASHALGAAPRAEIAEKYRYANPVFLVPPWPDIYARDGARRHGFEEAQAEYKRLRAAYPALGYKVVEVPRAPIVERARYVVAALAEPG